MAGFIFHVPPRLQGQIMEYAFAATGEGDVIRRITDRSDRSVAYHISKMLAADEGNYWNGEPANKRWRPMTSAEMRYHELV